MSPGAKLTAGGLLIAAATAYLAFLGASSSWQYYLSVDEAVAGNQHLCGRRVRVSGRVVAGTVSIIEQHRVATFELAGNRHTLLATCRCSLPDNFREDIDVVVEGKLQTNHLHGDKVITRCASKYESKAGAATRNITSSVRTALLIVSVPE
jgi:cytochrome c-type biogenesis protein CcmE